MNNNRSFALLAGVLGCYLAAALLYFGKPITVTDELYYVRQARAFAAGSTTMVGIDPTTGRETVQSPGIYAPGTAALMAPFVCAFGWQGAYLVPMLMVPVAVMVMAAWLASERRSPLWAMLMLAYPTLLVLGFHAMSDVPSLAIVTSVLFLFWHGAGRPWGYWFAAGFLASASCLIRETNAVLYVAFFCGALVRRERPVWALLLGGVLGLAFTFGCNSFVSDNLFRRQGELEFFSLHNIPANLPWYLAATLLCVPGGLIVACCYRGARKIELRLTVAIFLGFLLTWHSAVEGGLANRLILHAPRFALSLLPVFIWAWAEVGPRWWERLTARVSAPKRLLLTRATVAGLSGAVLIAVVGVHPAFYRWRQSRERIVREIYAHTEAASVVVTNHRETTKVMNELYGPRRVIDLETADADTLHALLTSRPSASLVLLLRSDGAFWQENRRRLEDRLDHLKKTYELTPVFDEPMTATDHLQVWKIQAK